MNLRSGHDADPEGSGALSMSNHGRKLYAQGDYTPASYAMIIAKIDAPARVSRADGFSPLTAADAHILSRTAMRLYRTACAMSSYSIG